jgi:hypothetical protein
MSMCYRVPTEGKWQPVDFKGGQSLGELQAAAKYSSMTPAAVLG